ncbi:MAG: hypothetical protein QOF76_1181 [Solirubrobacteraceae bacterium]|jgi:nucleotide-binding universal stress UspA family protein|nr:hypothetical protein [Solirubrobacteraceae bacterium]
MLTTIAVGTDGSSTADGAVDAAIDLAAAAGARLLILTSYQDGSDREALEAHRNAPDEVQWQAFPSGAAEVTMNAAAERARARGVTAETASAPGDPAAVLCWLAAKHNADILVVGDRGMHRRLLGSVPNSVAHQAPCSVLIVKTTERKRGRVAALVS